MDDFENPTEIENCKHKFCQECFHQYLVDKIKHNQIEQIPCPKKNCKTKNLSENFFSQFLTEQEYFKYRQFKAQNEIAKDSKKVFCPLCDSYANIEEGQDLMYDSNNPDYIKSTLKCQNGHEFCSCGIIIVYGNNAIYYNSIGVLTPRKENTTMKSTKGKRNRTSFRKVIAIVMKKNLKNFWSQKK